MRWVMHLMHRLDKVGRLWVVGRRVCWLVTFVLQAKAGAAIGLISSFCVPKAKPLE